jgi:phosphoribosyl-AMP cyclohydrolase / phosphoribosyl-ATP pyrophosphohydrolase
MSSRGIVIPDRIDFDQQSLVPVVVQDRTSGDVLMVAWANREAVDLTASTGLAHFWSRSRSALWKKGGTSGHVLLVREVRTDCDADTLLYLVDADGPACHDGTRTCFGDASYTKAGLLLELTRVVKSRSTEKPEGSYTASVMAKGLDHALKKVGEEATEVVLAAKGDTDERLAEEAADLVYHLIVAMAIRGVPFSRALDVLKQRRR